MTWQVDDNSYPLCPALPGWLFQRAIAGRAASDVIHYVRRDLAVDGVNTDISGAKQRRCILLYRLPRRTRHRQPQLFVCAPARFRICAQMNSRKLIENAEFLYLEFHRGRLRGGAPVQGCGRQLVFDAIPSRLR